MCSLGSPRTNDVFSCNNIYSPKVVSSLKLSLEHERSNQDHVAEVAPKKIKATLGVGGLNLGAAPHRTGNCSFPSFTGVEHVCPRASLTHWSFGGI